MQDEELSFKELSMKHVIVRFNRILIEHICAADIGYCHSILATVEQEVDDGDQPLRVTIDGDKIE